MHRFTSLLTTIGSLSLGAYPVTLYAQVNSPADQATIRLPKCLLYPDTHTYTPCTGVVPVDSTTGNALDWVTLLKGTPTNPSSTVPVNNGAPVSSSNPMPVIDSSNTNSRGTLGSTAPSSAQLVAGKDAGGLLKAISVDSAGFVNVNCAGCGGSGGGGSGGSNNAAVAIGTTTPTFTSYTGYLGADNSVHGWVGDNFGHPFVGLFGIASVQGSAVVGSAVTNNPVTIGFSDGALVQQAKGDPNTGAIYTEVMGRRQHWTESTTPLVANDTFVGASHDDGSASGGLTRWNTFSCFVLTDQNGTLNVKFSNDGTNWQIAQTTTITASASLFVSQAIFARYWRCEVKNGPVAQTQMISNAVFGN